MILKETFRKLFWTFGSWHILWSFLGDYNWHQKRRLENASRLVFTWILRQYVIYFSDHNNSGRAFRELVFPQTLKHAVVFSSQTRGDVEIDVSKTTSGSRSRGFWSISWFFFGDQKWYSMWSTQKWLQKRNCSLEGDEMLLDWNFINSRFVNRQRSMHNSIPRLMV